LDSGTTLREVDGLEYIGKVMDDGHIYLPETVRRQLKLEPDSSVHVIFSVKETKSLSANQG
jgi:bifunctional DNA-binding transcriptional regulator/antitoxin component of YhaV-PrlF toxin-antitoxin module